MLRVLACFLKSEKNIPVLFQKGQFSAVSIDIHNNFDNLNQFT